MLVHNTCPAHRGYGIPESGKHTQSANEQHIHGLQECVDYYSRLYNNHPTNDNLRRLRSAMSDLNKVKKSC